MGKSHQTGRADVTRKKLGETRKPRKLSKNAVRKKQRHKKVKLVVTDIELIHHISSYLTSCLRDFRDTLPWYRNADFLKDIEVLSRRLAAEGVRFATERLPMLFDGLIGYLEHGTLDFAGFKLLHSTHPHFLKGLVSPVMADPTSSKAVTSIGKLYQLCHAFKKLKGPANTKKLHDQYMEFVQTDIELSDVDWSTEPVRDIARKARKIIGKVVEGLDPLDPSQSELFKPRPGPGATNTPTDHACRYRPHVWFPTIAALFNPESWFRPPFCPPRRWNIQKGFHDTFCRVAKRKTKQLSVKVAAQPPRSRFKFVPKTYEKMRGICIEENEIQWHQQALRRGFYTTIERHPITKGYVNFTSQLVNGSKALEASRDSSFATIDMSEASDRISRNLVSYLFGENKQLLKLIEACSTEEVESPKGVGLEDTFIKYVPVKKIAPMGSAICFPIMSLVHFALIRAILDMSSVPQQYKREVFVYGDDIIIHRHCVQAVYDYLPLFGMKINTDKSFSRSYFRESCGVHAYKGVDVTPIRFKTVLNTTSSPADLCTALRLEEAFYYKGYKHVSRQLRQAIRDCAHKYGINNVPYVHTSSRLFGFFRRDRDARLVDFVIDHKRSWISDSIAIKTVSDHAASGSSFSQTWMYRGVAVIVDNFDDWSSFPCEEDRYLRYLVQNGIWASKKYDEGYSRSTYLRKVTLPESSLGYRC